MTDSLEAQESQIKSPLIRTGQNSTFTRRVQPQLCTDLELQIELEGGDLNLPPQRREVVYPRARLRLCSSGHRKVSKLIYLYIDMSVRDPILSFHFSD